MARLGFASLAGRKAFLAGASVFLVASVFGFLTYQDFRSIDEIGVEIDGTRASIDQSNSKIRRVPDLERDVVALRENLREYVKILPDEDEVNDFVNKINKFADIAKVGVEKLDDVGAKRRKAQKSKDPFEKVEYKLQLKGTTDSILRFVNLFENYDRFVRVASFDVKALRAASASLALDADLQLETFVYNPGGAAGPPVKIPDYEAKKERFAADIVRSRGEIKIERYELPSNPLRRDPFRDPRAAVGEPGLIDSVLSAEDQRKLLETLVAEVSDIDKMIEAESAPESGDDFIRKMTLTKEINERIKILARRVASLEKAKSIEVPNLKDKLKSGVKDRLEKWVKARNINAPTEIYSEQQLADFAGRMKAAYGRSEYDTVLKEFEAASRGFAPSDASERSKELILEIVSLKERAAANKEFGDRNIVVSGVIYRPEGSVAVVNGKVLSPGESLDGEVTIRAIEETVVEFAFKQVTIRRPVK